MEYHKSIKLTDKLYCYIWQGMGNNCNSCVITNVLNGDKPHIIIDPGHNINETGEQCFASLYASMSADNIKVEDIGLIINTHSHLDHCEANELIVQKSGASISLSEEEDKFRTTIGEEMCAMFGMTPPHFTPAFYLKEGTFNPGKDGFNIKVLLTPGHSPGSVCLYLPDTKVLITGDVVFFMSIGRTDFPGGNTLLLKKSIEKLMKLDIEYLIPGHNTEPMGIIKGKDNIVKNFEAVNEYFFQE